VRYRKVGPAAYLSHLDLRRQWAAMIRRAGYRPRMSEGFHPMPKLRFPPALPLGVPALGEVLDLWIEETPDTEALEAALRATAPIGLEVDGAVRLGAEHEDIVSAVHGADWLAWTTGPVPRIELGPAAQALLAAETLPWLRQRRRGDRKVDLRLGLIDIRAPAEEAEEIAGGLAIPAHASTAWMRLELRDAGPRADEVMACLLGRTTCEEISWTRLAVWLGTPDSPRDPLDI
jgi:radical SAM-linked protein